MTELKRMTVVQKLNDDSLRFWHPKCADRVAEDAKKNAAASWTLPEELICQDDT